MAIDSDEVRSKAEELLDAGAHDRLDTMRHSAAHMMAAAVLELFPGAKLGIGPAIDVMREQIGERLTDLGLVDEVEVKLTFAEPWTSDRISPAGREALRASGFAPPMTIGSTFSGDSLTVLPIATCPYCASRNTTLENPFGPTLCRAIYHCADCRQPFEAFKPV